jgi:hypothetical protein
MGHTQPLANQSVKGRFWPILLKNSIRPATLSVVEKVDPLERSQIDANERGDGLRPPKLTHEKGKTSFSTE